MTQRHLARAGAMLLALLAITALAAAAEILSVVVVLAVSDISGIDMESVIRPIMWMAAGMTYLVFCPLAWRKISKTIPIA